jgi:hypothetical protein
LIELIFARTFRASKDVAVAAAVQAWRAAR